MSQHVYEYPCNYVMTPHVMSHVSWSYMASSSKYKPLKSPVWEYIKIGGEKKVLCKLYVPPATTTWCVCACARAWMHASLCVCAPLNYLVFDKEATIWIAKITIHFCTISGYAAFASVQVNIQQPDLRKQNVACSLPYGHAVLNDSNNIEWHASLGPDTELELKLMYLVEYPLQDGVEGLPKS